MDWGNDYFTFSDTNIEYIWRLLKTCTSGTGSTWATARPSGARAAGRRSRSTSSIGSYVERADPSLYVRFPLVERPGESLVIWTTTPWTLPANVAAAVNPEAEYGRRANGEWVAVARYPDETLRGARRRGAELVGWTLHGAVRRARRQASTHRVIPWDEVSLEEGTGIVHIAPGCGSRGLRALARARPAGS